MTPTEEQEQGARLREIGEQLVERVRDELAELNTDDAGADDPDEEDE